jgi:predicted RNA-binding Zn-ribbon protein involved in translation (DUF1610 family)
MSKQKPKMKCPECGVDMNYHATKIDYSAAMKEPKAMDADFGGVMEEFHTCPKCGKAASRKAE